MRIQLALPLLVCLTACSSSEPAPEPAAAQPAQTAQAGSAPRKGVSASSPAPAARRAPSNGLPAGHVQFTVEKRPLDEVLKLFEDQVGLRIAWRGEPRPVSLRLAQPMRWEDALSLVCQFTRTHVARDYQGRYQLKDGYGGTLGNDDDVDALLKEQGGERAEGSSASGGGRVTAGRSGGASGGSAGSSGGTSGGTRYNEAGSGGLGKSEFGDAYGGGDTARGLLKGVSNTSSGPR